MSESFTSFFNQSFGLNVKLPQRTLKQVGKTVSETAGGAFTPLLGYLEANENVFSGEVIKEINKGFARNFNIGARLREADIQVNGEPHKFDSNF